MSANTRPKHEPSIGILRSVAQRIMLGSALRLATRREMAGFEVANLTESGQDGAALDAIDRVIQLIQGIDPGCLARMRRSFSRILVTPGGGSSGSYWHSLDACVLSADHVLNDPTSSVAMTLVHEATHARLHRAGIRYAAALRPRIEAICLKAEIQFGRQLPDSKQLIAEAEAALETRWWEKDQQEQREFAQLRKLGTPNWLLRVRHFFVRD